MHMYHLHVCKQQSTSIRETLELGCTCHHSPIELDSSLLDRHLSIRASMHTEFAHSIRNTMNKTKIHVDNSSY